MLPLSLPASISAKQCVLGSRSLSRGETNPSGNSKVLHPCTDIEDSVYQVTIQNLQVLMQNRPIEDLRDDLTCVRDDSGLTVSQRRRNDGAKTLRRVEASRPMHDVRRVLAQSGAIAPPNDALRRDSTVDRSGVIKRMHTLCEFLDIAVIALKHLPSFNDVPVRNEKVQRRIAAGDPPLHPNANFANIASMRLLEPALVGRIRDQSVELSWLLVTSMLFEGNDSRVDDSSNASCLQQSPVVRTDGTIIEQVAKADAGSATVSNPVDDSSILNYRSTDSSVRGLIADRLQLDLETPTVLVRAIRSLFVVSPSIAPKELAAVCGVSRRTLDRWMKRNGISSTRRLFASARIAWAYDTQCEDDICVARMAKSVGYASAGSLNKQCLAIAGMSLPELCDARSDRVADILGRAIQKTNLEADTNHSDAQGRPFSGQEL
jgi:AraC-like DNA-binding protein